MPAAIPSTEPERFTAGETLAWTRCLPDFPAGAGNVLKYALQSAGAVPALYTITATAAGDEYAVNVAAGTSAAWPPGIYTLTGYVEQGSTRTCILRRIVSILPGLLTALGSTHAARMLALIEAALENRIPQGLETTNIDGQELQRIPLTQLVDLRDRYRREVASTAPRRVRRPLGIAFVHPR